MCFLQVVYGCSVWAQQAGDQGAYFPQSLLPLVHSGDFHLLQVLDGGRVWAQQAGDPRVARLAQQLASASLTSSRVRICFRCPPATPQNPLRVVYKTRSAATPSSRRCLSYDSVATRAGFALALLSASWTH